MKKTTCRQMGGCCDFEIIGETPEEMIENDKKHVMNMVLSGNDEHQKAMDDMMAKSPEDQQKFMDDWMAGFNDLPEA